MKAKLFAITIASAISMPVFAQSGVEIHGSVDAFVGSTKIGDQRASAMGSSGLSNSWIGFSGTEQLGHGLKAHFSLEREFDVDEISERIPPSPGGGLARRGRRCLPQAHVSAAFPGSECSA